MNIMVSFVMIMTKNQSKVESSGEEAKNILYQMPNEAELNALKGAFL